ncbi:recombinase family protein [Streptomyces sp. MS1.HAVA.3]|uniref:Recombinase family protein n=1 Tax=Streptomyces caledonius TaxID=3134107 RepID=A0ABU8U555_9ACTN
MAKPKRVGIYVRISRDRKGQELGIKRQERACRELCEQRGWSVHKIYPENDTSASTTSRKQRPQYAEMMRDAKAGVIDAIVVYSIDRLTRRIAELTSFLEEQKAYAFQFATTEGEDTSTASGRMILTIKGAVAQQETERMAERINGALLQRREQGKPHAGGKRQFGFKAGSHFQELNDEETNLIRLGYEMLVRQKSPGDVSRMWSERGTTTPQGATWTIQAVKRVYRSQRTGGIITYKGQDIGDSTYPSPLTRKEWESVQVVLDRRATPAAQGSGKRKHVYSGFLKCGHCQATMRVQWATIQGRTFRRTFCNSSQRGGNGGLGCGKVNRKYDWIVERLNEVVEAALLTRQPTPPAASHGELTDEVREAEERIRLLRLRWKEGRMEDEDYFDSLTHLRVQLQQLRTREADAVAASTRTETDALAVWRDESEENLERRRAVVASVIKEVQVFSIGRGCRKPPETDSIKIALVSAESGGQEE